MPVKVSTTRLSDILSVSQQSASRHLMLLEEMGLVSRRIDADGTMLRITEDGLRALNEVFHGLRRHLEGGEAEAFVFEGVVFSGLEEGGYYLGKAEYRDQIRERLGFEPYPGTLNLRLREADLERRRQLEMLPAVVITGFRNLERTFGSGRCYPAVVNDEVEGALVVADRTTYDLSVMEIISPHLPRLPPGALRAEGRRRRQGLDLQSSTIFPLIFDELFRSSLPNLPILTTLRPSPLSSTILRVSRSMSSWS